MEHAVVKLLLLFMWIDSFNFVNCRKSMCSIGTFECQITKECIDKDRECDRNPDCLDQSDEKNCDRNQDDYWNGKFRKRPQGDLNELSIACYFSEIPDGCICRAKTRIFCSGGGLKDIPQNLPKQVTYLDLSNNAINELSSSVFSKFLFLSNLYLQQNDIKDIDNMTFDKCPQLHILNLNSNKLYLMNRMFDESNDLKELYVENNLLTELNYKSFENLYQLKKLYLGNNKIKTIHPDTFECLSNLEILSLKSNKLTSIKNDYFRHLPKLYLLYLEDNAIYSIEDDSFKWLLTLSSLGLSKNQVHRVESNTFRGLRNLTHLNLMSNHISMIASDALKPLIQLRSLDVRDNAFQSLHKDTLTTLQNLQYIYFDEFYMCAYVSKDVSCQPFGDGISSHYNLLENSFLRVMIWIVALFACLGNLFVILGRFILREDNQVHSFYIKNLSLADMLMGVYLIIIGVQDQIFRGNYLLEDQAWRHSATCNTCGVLSTLSSEASVLTLSVITFDRYTSITLPLFGRRKSFKFAYVNVSAVWLISLILTIVPLLETNYFGTNFYQDNAVCIPLHLHRPWVRGWQYSVFLFLGLNLAAFTFICFAYISMFVAIRRSTKTVRTHFENQERALVKRFFFIIITDFLCWIPIIVIKFLAIGGVKINPELYAWLVIFVMPINSALNPLLYTLTTKLFRAKIIPRLCCGFTIVRQEPIIRESSSSSSSSSSRKRRTSLRSALEKDLSEVGATTLKFSSRRSDGCKDMLMSSFNDTRRSREYLCFKNRNEMRNMYHKNGERKTCVKDLLYTPVTASSSL